MLLAVDIGNTNITCGIYEEEEMRGRFRLTTKTPRTSDEYGMTICNLIEQRGLCIKDITDVIISSVVPAIMHSFCHAVQNYLHIEPIEVKAGIKTGIKLDRVANPLEIGADRIVDAVGAYEMYGGPVIVMDFGTATTYDLILEDGTFAAGITSPGIRISAKALWEDAAKLPEIAIRKPDTILAKDTITSMQAGLMYGYIGQTEYIVDKIIEESGLSDVKTVATGGLGKIIADETDRISFYDPNLTLNGLRLIFNKCKGKEKGR